MADDDSGHADACDVVAARQQQLDETGEISNYWPDGALCTCHHWWRYNEKNPTAWFIADLVRMDG